MVCISTPQFCLDFLLRSKTDLKESPPSASHDCKSSTYNKLEDMVRHTTKCKLYGCTVVNTSTSCFTHSVMHYNMHCLHAYNTQY